MLISCAPVKNISLKGDIKTNDISQKEINSKEITKNETIVLKKEGLSNNDQISEFDPMIKDNITIILSKRDNQRIVKQLINVTELAVYQKQLKNIYFDIKLYETPEQLVEYLNNSDLKGKIFIGPLSTPDTKLIRGYCSEGAVFFSFSSNKKLANECVYLVNFFPENELRTIFEYFPNNSKVALLYPENEYGFKINKIIDSIADKSNSIIINRASYNQDLSNAPEAIKELGNYQLRKYELNRQKKILANKKDDESKKRLKKLERFSTTKDYDFSHIIIADYGLRLLQVAPLLPYYDIDPNIVQFVGTGAWDDEVFYDEPSLSGSIYPGIEFMKRKKLVEDYNKLYSEKLLRTSTLSFDLVGLLAFILNNKHNLSSLYELLNKSNIKFSGVDGDFYFLNNAIERDLGVLRIEEGKVKIISK